jgi:lysophospholipase L1-like esterase
MRLKRFGVVAAGLFVTTAGLPPSVTTAQTSVPDAVAADAPVAYWKLDDTSGSVAADLATPSHPGTYRNNVTFSPERPSTKFAGSRLFGGGACDGVEVDGSVTQIPNAISLEAWVKPATTSGVLLFRYRNFGYHFTISNGRIGYSAYGGGAGIEGTRDIRDGQWHHVVAVRTNETPSKQRIYVDGVLDTEVQAAAGPWNTQYGGASRQGSIGRDGTACDGIVSSYRGHMAGFAIFNKALSESQVKAHYEWGAPPTGPGPFSLVSVTAKSPVLVGRQVVVSATTTPAGAPVGFYVLAGAASSLSQGTCVQASEPVPGPVCQSDLNGKVQWRYRPAEAGRETVRVFADRNGDGVFQAGEQYRDVQIEVVAPTELAAIGDSFTSGQGIDNDRNLLQPCNQSRIAYPMRFKLPWYSKALGSGAEPKQSDEGKRLRSAGMGFLACSGATAGPDDPAVPQVGRIGSANLVTVMLGRNGDGSPDTRMFREYLRDCFWVTPDYKGCESGGYKAEFIAKAKGELDVLAGSVQARVSEIRAAHPNATVLMVGYPQIFAAAAFRNQSVWGCGSLYGIDLPEMEVMRELTTYFNTQLAEAARNAGVFFVDTETEFDQGHQPCATKEDWISGAKVTKSGTNFHPNAAGHRAFARLLQDFLAARRSDAAVVLNANGLPKNPAPGAAMTRMANLAVAFAVTSAAPPTGTGGLVDFGVEVVGADPTCTLHAVRQGANLRLTAAGLIPGSTVGAAVRSVGFTWHGPNAVVSADGTVSVSLTLPPVTPGLVALELDNADRSRVVASTVTPVLSSNPVCARPDTATTPLNTAVDITVAANDVTGLGSLRGSEIRVVSSPEKGTVTTNPNGTLRFQPFPGEYGTDTFGYRICDSGSCAEQYVDVSIDPSCTITGTPGNDVLLGTPGPDVICGLDGDDTISGGEGNDIVLAASGDDVIYGQGGNDQLFGGEGADYLSGGSGTNTYSDVETEPELAGDPITTNPPVNNPATPNSLAATITSPQPTVYGLGQNVVATFSCSNDAIACAATNNNGTSIDTSTIGEHTFTVTATNSTGRQATTTAVYRVAPVINTNATITPIVECVELTADGILAARFGYDNNEPGDVTIPAGPVNTVTGATTVIHGPTTEFTRPGVLANRPGRTLPDQGAFIALFPPTGTVTWTLAGKTATANNTTRRCPTPGTVPSNGWITTSGSGITIAGAKATVRAPLHSNTSITISGAQHQFSGQLSYISTFTVNGQASINPAPIKTTTQPTPSTPTLAEYRPGGQEALAANRYVAIPVTDCVNGIWTRQTATLEDNTTYYVPCAANLNGANTTRTITIAAEGPITLNGANLTLKPPVSTGPVLIAAGPVSSNGANATFNGTITSDGAFTASGANVTTRCAITASSINVSGANLTADTTCQPTN